MPTRRTPHGGRSHNGALVPRVTVLHWMLFTSLTKVSKSWFPLPCILLAFLQICQGWKCTPPHPSFCCWASGDVAYCAEVILQYLILFYEGLNRGHFLFNPLLENVSDNVDMVDFVLICTMIIFLLITCLYQIWTACNLTYMTDIKFLSRFLSVFYFASYTNANGL